MNQTTAAIIDAAEASIHDTTIRTAVEALIEVARRQQAELNTMRVERVRLARALFGEGMGVGYYAPDELPEAMVAQARHLRSLAPQ